MFPSMGMLVDGRWSTQWYQPDQEGRFLRSATTFRHWIKQDGSTPFAPESGRYHLYVSLACPWAHRTLLVHSLRKLAPHIGLSVVHPHMGDAGWSFEAYPGSTGDTLLGTEYLRDVYLRAEPGYTGRVTVPVLWDTKHDTIVNNESREIMRMFDLELRSLGDSRVSFLPEGKEAEVDAAIDALYHPINNGVYRAGFATTQHAYEEAVGEVFRALDELEKRLQHRRYLLGDRITEADWCLFTTLYRFDPVYHYHFKCNRHRLRDYPNLWSYVRDLYRVPGVAPTCNIDHVKRHYFTSHGTINPTGIIPDGPEIDYAAAIERD